MVEPVKITRRYCSISNQSQHLLVIIAVSKNIDDPISIAQECISCPFTMTDIIRRRFPNNVSVNTLYPDATHRFTYELYKDWKFVVSRVDKFQPLILECKREEFYVIKPEDVSQ